MQAIAPRAGTDEIVVDVMFSAFEFGCLENDQDITRQEGAPAPPVKWSARLDGNALENSNARRAVAVSEYRKMHR